MKYVDDVIRDLGISYDDIVKIFIDSGYTEEDAEEFCCNKWYDVKDTLLFDDEECFVKLAKLFGIDRNKYKWQESNKSSKRKMSESNIEKDFDNDNYQIELQNGTVYVTEKSNYTSYKLQLTSGKSIEVLYDRYYPDRFELAKNFTSKIESSYINTRDDFLNALDCIMELLES